MAEVKWIKLTTTMFDDEKIKLIEAMPDADSLLVIWIKLLCQAGKANASGHIILSETIPYTEEMLSTIFGRPLNTIRLALDTLTKLGMIQNNGDGIYITNWSKYQNDDALQRIREANRKRVAEHRERQKLLTDGKDLKDNKDRDIDIESNVTVTLQEVTGLYHNICKSLPTIRTVTDKRKKTIKARIKQYPDLTTYEELFTKTEASDFLTGRDGKWSGCNFDWLLNENNMVKVLEGNYANKTDRSRDRGGRTLEEVKRQGGYQ